MDIKNLDIKELSDKIKSVSSAESKKSRARVEDLKSKIRHIEPLCSAVVERIRIILSGLNGDASPDEKLQYIVTNISALATTLSAEPSNVRTQITAAMASADAWDTAGSKIEEIVIGTIENNAKISAMAAAMKDGHDYSKPRKIGQRPESLKSIRQARKILEEDSDDD